jgi:integrase
VLAAHLHERALMLNLLLVDPVRRRTLAAIDLQRHVRHDERGRTIGLHIPRNETKNGIEIETPFDAPLAARFARHLRVFRPSLRGAQGPFLFPSPDGGARNPDTVAKRMTQIVRDALGTQFTPKLMRHIVATMLFEASPENSLVAQRVLRHTSIKTTEQMYGVLRNRGALRVYHETVRRQLARVPTTQPRESRR